MNLTRQQSPPIDVPRFQRTALCCLPRPRGRVSVGLAARSLLAVAALAGAIVFSPLGAALAAPDNTQPGDPGALSPGAAAPNTTPGDSEIKARLSGAGPLTIAGEPVHTALLRKFYDANGDQPVWVTHQAQATALWHAVLNAQDQGLDPDDFHAVALAKPALAPIDRDMLLSDAVLGYADALARGVVPAEMRPDDQDLAPEPVDVVAALNAALNSPDPAAAINGLAPQTPAYAGLRHAYESYRAIVKAGGWPRISEAPGAERARSLQQRLAIEGFLPNGYATNSLDEQTVAALKKFQESHGLDPNGALGSGTLIELNVPAELRARQVAVNLERQRWLPRHLPADRVWVNTASAELQLFQNNQPTFTTRVVVGETDKQTPEFHSNIVSVLYNPPWYIPYSIAQKEIMPLIEADPDYLERHHMTMRDNGAIQQEAGPYSALGRLKFEIPNKFDVYLHDTPQRAFFSRGNRRLSHGCVRVQNPRDLASILLGIPEEQITAGINTGATTRHNLPQPMPVFLVYQTAFIDSDGVLQFRQDVYQRDSDIAQHLTHGPQPPLAQQSPSNQRGG